MMFQWEQRLFLDFDVKDNADSEKRSFNLVEELENYGTLWISYVASMCKNGISA